MVFAVLRDVFPGAAATSMYACPACRAQQGPHERPDLESEGALRHRAVDGSLPCVSTAHQLELLPVVEQQLVAEMATRGAGKWIMVSYQWDSKKQVLRLKAVLEAAGYRVWFDEDQMGGNMNARMAEAVEGAAAVVACVTEAYQKSHNCMLEFNYANEKRKLIIPVIMDEAQTKAENQRGPVWLVLAGKLYYDCSTDGKVEAGLKKLLEVPKDGLPLLLLLLALLLRPQLRDP
eukprot:TRINITY_DN5007_c0_g1_i1.p4 TRINITY_DN5007_c0_g1~~TRINITY_DN5007_c0_g1_i1.p4  ORF type:complete len:233 (-),score=45.83 TRINITY_DN5007_c0_g1_i1:98-796(-)